jgi:hypothetical protein
MPTRAYRVVPIRAYPYLPVPTRALSCLPVPTVPCRVVPTRVVSCLHVSCLGVCRARVVPCFVSWRAVLGPLNRACRAVSKIKIKISHVTFKNTTRDTYRAGTDRHVCRAVSLSCHFVSCRALSREHDFITLDNKQILLFPFHISIITALLLILSHFLSSPLFALNCHQITSCCDLTSQLELSRLKWDEIKLLVLVCDQMS